MKDCNHFWVNRKDGYTEQCVPAICLKCGKYGCYCDFVDAELKSCSTESEKYAKKHQFYNRGIDGNNHEIERRIREEEIANQFNRFEIMDI